MEDKILTVPIHLKMTLTAREAAEYSNIGINKIDSMLRTGTASSAMKSGFSCLGMSAPAKPMPLAALPTL